MMVAFMDQPFAGAFTSEATRTPVRTKSNPRTRRTETRSFIGGTSPRENVDAGGVLRPPETTLWSPVPRTAGAHYVASKKPTPATAHFQSFFGIARRA